MMRDKGHTRGSEAASKPLVRLLIVALVVVMAVGLSLGVLDAALAHPIIVLPLFGFMVMCWVWSQSG
jgi:hypothetical protein